MEMKSAKDVQSYQDGDDKEIIISCSLDEGGVTTSAVKNGEGEAKDVGMSQVQGGDVKVQQEPGGQRDGDSPVPTSPDESSGGQGTCSCAYLLLSVILTLSSSGAPLLPLFLAFFFLSHSSSHFFLSQLLCWVVRRRGLLSLLHGGRERNSECKNSRLWMSLRYSTRTNPILQMNFSK